MHKIMEKYIQYIKDNPENHWFRARWYGWGWVPATWQGWLSTAVYIFLVIVLGVFLDENKQAKENTVMFLLVLTLLTISFCILAYKKGERPKWSWGPPSDKDST